MILRGVLCRFFSAKNSPVYNGGASAALLRDRCSVIYESKLPSHLPLRPCTCPVIVNRAIDYNNGHAALLRDGCSVIYGSKLPSHLPLRPCICPAIVNRAIDYNNGHAALLRDGCSVIYESKLPERKIEKWRPSRPPFFEL